MIDTCREPNLFVLGTAKAGTTTVYNWLNSCREINMASLKEPHYYSSVRPDKSQEAFTRYIEDYSQYQGLFDWSGEEYLYWGDASPSYLHSTDACKKIENLSKERQVKAVICLRDPVERAFSHFLMDVREGLQSPDATFLSALEKDFHSHSKGWGVSHMYVELSLYYDAVKRYIDALGRENLYFLKFENLLLSESDELQKLANFLSVEITESVKGVSKNPFGMPRNRLSALIMASSSVRALAKKILPHSITSYLKNEILIDSSLKKPVISPAEREVCWGYFEGDVKKLNSLFCENYYSL